MIISIQPKIRIRILQLLFNIRIRSSDLYVGMNLNKTDLIVYGLYRYKKKRMIEKLII
jgi:hypothetical protein